MTPIKQSRVYQDMINGLLNNALKDYDAPGILCALNINDQITTHSAGKVVNTDHDRPFYIYSISKTFTATAILKLCEIRGCFLDAPVTSILPDAKIPENITVRQLLNHTGGLSDYFSQKEYQDAVHEHPDRPWTYEKLMEVGLKDTPLFPAGTGWSYSNPAYGLLKEIIHQISGEEYYIFVREFIIDPLQLHHTRPFLEPDHATVLLPGKDSAMSHDFRTLYHPGWIATGCFISTVSDITRFYQGVFAEKVIDRKSLNQMTQLVEVPFPSPPPRIAAYGLGLMSAKNDPQGEHFGHGGGGPGYTTYARHYPNLNGQPTTLAMVITCSMPQTPFALADQVIASL